MAALEAARRELSALLPGQKAQTVVPFPDAEDDAEDAKVRATA